jgi:C-terminal processing protease CtpA/Prc
MKFQRFTPAGLRLRVSIVTFFLVLITVTLCPESLRAQEFGSIERDRAKVMLNSVKNEIKKNYYDPAYHGVDLDARFKVAEDKLKQATSMGQVFGIIAQAVLDLNDSHTTFFPPERSASVEYGWEIKMIGDKCYLFAIKPGSDAASKLKLGDQVLAIDGIQPARENLWKLYYLYYSLRPQPGVRMIVQSPEGEPRQVDVLAKVKQGKKRLDFTRDLNDYYGELREAENESRLHDHHYVTLGKDKELFVWKMPQFDSPQLVEEMMGKAKNSKALILDLRGNGGGAEVTLLKLLGYFVDKDTKVGDIKMRKETKPMIAKSRGGETYKGKLIVLVDSQSASSSEVFARTIQLEKRGIVIGDNTAGAVMRGIYHSLQLGSEVIVPYGVQVTNADLVMTDGKSLENVGVTPDERKLPTAKELASNLDPVLAYAAVMAGVDLTPEKAGTYFPVLWKK